MPCTVVPGGRLGVSNCKLCAAWIAETCACLRGTHLATWRAGRRHQLRVHCAQALKAPIIGDTRYSYGGLDAALPLRDKLPEEWWQLFAGTDLRSLQRSRPGHWSGHQPAGAAVKAPILLHARQLVVKRPGKQGVSAIAPVPRYILQLIDAAGWPRPNDS